MTKRWLGFIIIGLIAGMLIPGWGQERKIRWKKKIFKGAQPVEIFHATLLVNLPTTELLSKGNLEFIVSHRFIPSVGEGIDALFGMDGPAYIQLSLAYAPINRLMIALERSNRENHYQLWVKGRLWESGGAIPAALAIKAGIGVAAENPTISGRSRFHSRNWQYFAFLPLNLRLQKNLMAGIVPAVVYNAYIYSRDPEYSASIGGMLEYFVTDAMGIYGEWNQTVSGYRATDSKSFAFGVEFETGGHFFKIFLTNSTRLNGAQVIPGVDRRIDAFGDLHLGFTITRLLRPGEKW